VSRPRTVRALALTVVTAAALSACGTHPGSAAMVGSETISDSRLDDVATALCAAQEASAQAQQSDQAVAARAARQSALSVLVDTTLSRQFAESRGVEPNQGQVSKALAGNQATIDALPASERSVYRRTLTEYVEGQLSLIEVGRQELARRGVANATEQRALATATRLRNRWVAANADVSVDPRYGSFSGGALKAGNGSLSVAVSSDAVAGAKATPDAAWVDSLPASQKCR
jgi:hypothetical protein